MDDDCYARNYHADRRNLSLKMIGLYILVKHFAECLVYETI